MASSTAVAAAGAAPGVDEIDTSLLVKGRNARDIPEVVFIEDVPSFLQALAGGRPGAQPVPVETAIGAFNELYSKYKMYEANLDRTRASTKLKIPEIERSLDLVRHLIEKQGSAEKIKTHYNLADTVYGRAELEGDGRVCIWLGANVMLEYSYTEALELLESSLANAGQKMAETVEDLQLLRNNIITVEVNMARIFNWDVKRRRELDAKK
jgi:prefoldin subunit 5